MAGQATPAQIAAFDAERATFLAENMGVYGWYKDRMKEYFRDMADFRTKHGHLNSDYFRFITEQMTNYFQTVPKILVIFEATLLYNLQNSNIDWGVHKNNLTSFGYTTINIFGGDDIGKNFPLQRVVKEDENHKDNRKIVNPVISNEQFENILGFSADQRTLLKQSREIFRYCFLSAPELKEPTKEKTMLLIRESGHYDPAQYDEKKDLRKRVHTDGTEKVYHKYAITDLKGKRNEDLIRGATNFDGELNEFDWVFQRGGCAFTHVSQHHHYSRILRRAYYYVIMHIEEDPLRNTNVKIETNIGRSMLRRRSQTPETEKWHKDVSTPPAAKDVKKGKKGKKAKSAAAAAAVVTPKVDNLDMGGSLAPIQKPVRKNNPHYGGWINLDFDYIQSLRCLRASHDTAVVNRHRFAKLTDDEVEEEINSSPEIYRETVEIYPGSILIFNERLSHEVNPAKYIEQHRMFLGYTLTPDRESLLDQNLKYLYDTSSPARRGDSKYSIEIDGKQLLPQSREIIELDTITLPSGQECLQYSDNHWTFDQKRADLHHWSKHTFKPLFLHNKNLEGDVNKGKVKGQVIPRNVVTTVVQQRIPSLKYAILALAMTESPTIQEYKNQGIQLNAVDILQILMPRYRLRLKLAQFNPRPQNNRHVISDNDKVVSDEPRNIVMEDPMSILKTEYLAELTKELKELDDDYIKFHDLRDHLMIKINMEAENSETAKLMRLIFSEYTPYDGFNFRMHAFPTKNIFQSYFKVKNKMKASSAAGDPPPPPSTSAAGDPGPSAPPPPPQQTENVNNRLLRARDFFNKFSQPLNDEEKAQYQRIIQDPKWEKEIINIPVDVDKPQQSRSTKDRLNDDNCWLNDDAVHAGIYGFERYVTKKMGPILTRIKIINATFSRKTAKGEWQLSLQQRKKYLRTSRRPDRASLPDSSFRSILDPAIHWVSFIVNPGAHWYVILVHLIRSANGTFDVYIIDSKELSNDDYRPHLQLIIETMLAVLQDDKIKANARTDAFRDATPQSFNFIRIHDTPQNNDIDCGLFAISNTLQLLLVGNSLRLTNFLSSRPSGLKGLTRPERHNFRQKLLLFFDNWSKSLITRTIEKSAAAGVGEQKGADSDGVGEQKGADSAGVGEQKGGDKDSSNPQKRPIWHEGGRLRRHPRLSRKLAESLGVKQGSKHPWMSSDELVEAFGDPNPKKQKKNDPYAPKPLPKIKRQWQYEKTPLTKYDPNIIKDLAHQHLLSRDQRKGNLKKYPREVIENAVFNTKSKKNVSKWKRHKDVEDIETKFIGHIYIEPMNQIIRGAKTIEYREVNRVKEDGSVNTAYVKNVKGYDDFFFPSGVKRAPLSALLKFVNKQTPARRLLVEYVDVERIKDETKGIKYNISLGQVVYWNENLGNTPYLYFPTEWRSANKPDEAGKDHYGNYYLEGATDERDYEGFRYPANMPEVQIPTTKTQTQTQTQNTGGTSSNTGSSNTSNQGSSSGSNTSNQGSSSGSNTSNQGSSSGSNTSNQGSSSGTQGNNEDNNDDNTGGDPVVPPAWLSQGQSNFYMPFITLAYFEVRRRAPKLKRVNKELYNKVLRRARANNELLQIPRQVFIQMVNSITHWIYPANYNYLVQQYTTDIDPDRNNDVGHLNAGVQIAVLSGSPLAERHPLHVELPNYSVLDYLEAAIQIYYQNAQRQQPSTPVPDSPPTPVPDPQDDFPHSDESSVLSDESSVSSDDQSPPPPPPPPARPLSAIVDNRSRRTRWGNLSENLANTWQTNVDVARDIARGRIMGSAAATELANRARDVRIAQEAAAARIMGNAAAAELANRTIDMRRAGRAARRAARQAARQANVALNAAPPPAPPQAPGQGDALLPHPGSNAGNAAPARGQGPALGGQAPGGPAPGGPAPGGPAPGGPAPGGPAPGGPGPGGPPPPPPPNPPPVPPAQPLPIDNLNCDQQLFGPPNNLQEQFNRTELTVQNRLQSRINPKQYGMGFILCLKDRYKRAYLVIQQIGQRIIVAEHDRLNNNLGVQPYIQQIMGIEGFYLDANPTFFLMELKKIQWAYYRDRHEPRLKNVLRQLKIIDKFFDETRAYNAVRQQNPALWQIPGIDEPRPPEFLKKNYSFLYDSTPKFIYVNRQNRQRFQCTLSNLECRGRIGNRQCRMSSIYGMPYCYIHMQLAKLKMKPSHVEPGKMGLYAYIPQDIRDVPTLVRPVFIPRPNEVLSIIGNQNENLSDDQFVNLLRNNLIININAPNQNIVNVAYHNFLSYTPEFNNLCGRYGPAFTIQEKVRKSVHFNNMGRMNNNPDILDNSMRTYAFITLSKFIMPNGDEFVGLRALEPIYHGQELVFVQGYKERILDNYEQMQIVHKHINKDKIPTPMPPQEMFQRLLYLEQLKNAANQPMPDTIDIAELKNIEKYLEENGLYPPEEIQRGKRQRIY